MIAPFTIISIPLMIVLLASPVGGGATYRCSPAAAATADKAVNAIARSGIARMNASGHVHLPDRMQA
jgi:hypothetical protein